MILFTSDTNSKRQQMAKTGFIYLLVSLFFVLFGAVYEYFSHEVYSYFMLYAFAIPLVGRVLPYFSLAYFDRLHVPNRAICNIYNSGIATLTVGSCITGVLEIYGTTNKLTNIYWIVGFAFLAIAVILYLVSLIFSDKNKA